MLLHSCINCIAFFIFSMLFLSGTEYWGLLDPKSLLYFANEASIPPLCPAPWPAKDMEFIPQRSLL